jgi:hypothetical protein
MKTSVAPNARKNTPQLAFPILKAETKIQTLQARNARRSEESKAGGAGVAAGHFACGIVFAIAAFLSPFLSFFPDPYAQPKGNGAPDHSEVTYELARWLCCEPDQFQAKMQH